MFIFLRSSPLILLLVSCTAPIGASRTSINATYRQIEMNAIRSGRPSVETAAILHRYGLQRAFSEVPEATIRQLHVKAVETGDRDILFALAEISFLTADRIRRSVRPWDIRDARDYYLATAVYSYFFLFKDGQSPSGFDRRFRVACDLYNFGLGLALEKRKGTNGVVELGPFVRKLPVGELNIALDTSGFPWPLHKVETLLLADGFRVRGLTIRNREAGIGAPLIVVASRELGASIRQMTGATAFLRLNCAFRDLTEGQCPATLELHSAFGKESVKVENNVLPLEIDSTVHLACGLNQPTAWKLYRLQFLSLDELVPTDVYPTQPYERGRIPVVFVHGTYSSPVYWAEMLNSLRADTEVRERYQFWFFIYNSSAPLLVSAGKLRRAIAAQISKFDPDGTDKALQQAVIVSHSQGGLLTKMITTETGDKLWNSVSEKPLEQMDLSPEQKEKARQLFFLTPLPCVRRVIFIATPHRGSYRAGGLLQSLSRRLVRIPSSLKGRAQELMSLARQLKLPQDVDRKKITSIDGMSPRSPLLKSLVELPVSPQVKAHSIIPVRAIRLGNRGNDGVLTYSSAHLDDVESELIVRHNHSCQHIPEVIEEVRRILHLHLDKSAPEFENSPVAPVRFDGGRTYRFNSMIDEANVLNSWVGSLPLFRPDHPRADGVN